MLVSIDFIEEHLIVSCDVIGTSVVSAA